MLPLPERIWIARKDIQRHDGIEFVEQILRREETAQAFRAEGYDVRCYVSAMSADGRVEAASLSREWSATVQTS